MLEKEQSTDIKCKRLSWTSMGDLAKLKGGQVTTLGLGKILLIQR